MATSRFFMVAALLAAAGLACGVFGPQLKPTADALQYEFGDAADPGFPTLYDTQSSRLANRHGAVHKDITRAWLGLKLSAESDADDPADADGVPNLVNSDQHDDGIVGFTAPGAASGIDVRVSAAAGFSGSLYLNVLADLNDDGQWRDEWLVQNHAVEVQGLQSLVVSLPLAAEPGVLATAWLRITLSGEPIDASAFADAGGWDGSAPADGFAIGETEDYHGVLDIEPTPTPDGSYFNVECEELTEAIVHGESVTIGLIVVAGPGAPTQFKVVGTSGTMGVNGDPLAQEITVDPNPPADPTDPDGYSPFGPGAGIDITTTEDPPDRTVDYEVVVELKGPGRVETEKCLFSVVHLSLPAFREGPGDGFDFSTGGPADVPSFADILSVEQDQTESTLAFVFELAGPPPDAKTLGTQRLTYKVGLQLPDQTAGFGAGVPAAEGIPPTDPPMRWGYGASVDCNASGCTGVLFQSNAAGQFQVVGELEFEIEDNRVIVFLPLEAIGNPSSFDWAAIASLAGGGADIPTDRFPDGGFQTFEGP